MRAIVQLNDYDPDELYEEGDDEIDLHADERAKVPDVETEFYPGSGNIHVVDPVVDQVAELVSGNVVIWTPDVRHEVVNANLVTVYDDE